MAHCLLLRHAENAIEYFRITEAVPQRASKSEFTQPGKSLFERLRCISNPLRIHFVNRFAFDSGTRRPVKKSGHSSQRRSSVQLATGNGDGRERRGGRARADVSVISWAWATQKWMMHNDSHLPWNWNEPLLNRL